MSKGLGVLVAVVGAAWLVAGTGAAANALSSQGAQARMADEEIAQAKKRADDFSMRATDEIQGITSKRADKLEKARKDLEQANAELDLAARDFDEKARPKIEERDAARAAGDEKKAAALDPMVKNLEDQRAYVLRAPLKKRDSADEAYKKVQAETQRLVGEVSARIDETNKRRDAEILGITSRPQAQGGLFDWVGPLIGALLGLLALIGGVALALAAGGRSRLVPA
jgi:hypothetical protein